MATRVGCTARSLTCGPNALPPSLQRRRHRAVRACATLGSHRRPHRARPPPARVVLAPTPRGRNDTNHFHPRVRIVTVRARGSPRRPRARARLVRIVRPPSRRSPIARPLRTARARDALKRIGVGVTAHPPARRRFVVLVVVEAYLLSERRVAQRRTRSRARRPSRRRWESLHWNHFYFCRI